MLGESMSEIRDLWPCFQSCFQGRGHVLNSSLALKQFSFTHIGRVLRLRRCYTISQTYHFTDMLFSLPAFVFR